MRGMQWLNYELSAFFGIWTFNSWMGNTVCMQLLFVLKAKIILFSSCAGFLALMQKHVYTQTYSAYTQSYLLTNKILEYQKWCYLCLTLFSSYLVSVLCTYFPFSRENILLFLACEYKKSFGMHGLRHWMFFVRNAVRKNFQLYLKDFFLINKK